MVTGPEGLARAAADLVADLGPGRLRVLADRLEQHWPRESLPVAVPVPGFADAAVAVLDAQFHDGLSDAETVAYLRGVAAGYEQRLDAVQVETVWSGPATVQVPVRATAQVLAELVGEARSELVLMTYSAREYQPVLDALATAVHRRVAVTVVVETLAGAGSAMSGPEPATAFLGVPGVQLWHWPVERRTEPGAKMHAKVAVADRRVLLVSSANLTQSGVSRNLEAGVLVRGGRAPQRVTEHIAELKAIGALSRLRPGLEGDR